MLLAETNGQAVKCLQSPEQAAFCPILTPFGRVGSNLSGMLNKPPTVGESERKMNYPIVANCGVGAVVFRSH